MALSPHIEPLTSSRAQDAELFGTKTATLAKLTAMGLDVPSGVAIGATEYLHAISTENIPQKTSYPDFSAWASAIHQALLAQPVQSDLLAELMPHLERMGPSPWIVRSSAVGEDGQTSSFAGQLDSISDVTAEHLAGAIARVWASAWSSRAALYRERRGLTALDDLAVSVLIMPFIEPDYAGVAFTSSPIPGEQGMVVEAVQGRGEQLVGGSAAPSRYIFDEWGQPIPDTGHTPFEVPLPLLREIFAAGNSLATSFGSPQDVEWVGVAGRLIIVQSRPITTVSPVSQQFADPEDFVISVELVDSANLAAIPPELQEKDKFKLRLIASDAQIPVGRGWLLSAIRRDDSVSQEQSAASISLAASELASQVQRFEQISLVLQRPARLNGDIVRQFTNTGNLEERLRSLIGRIGAHHDQFELIGTEIYQAHKSGISHLVGDQLIVELAFGSYVPKGIVPTSLYVVDPAGRITQHVEVVQESGIFIVDGAPQDRAVHASATLDAAQLENLRHMTQVVSDAYPDVSVEFGVLEDGICYLIDIIPDMAKFTVDDVRVMSPGVVQGTCRVSMSDDLAAESLDAHFHSERTSGASADASTIVVAPRPFLALESHLSSQGPGNIGFIFEHGSLLGHLAIILREHQVPAIVVSDACAIIPNGATATIDTGDSSLYSIASDPLR